MFRLSPTVKSLLIINVIVFAISALLQNIDVDGILAMYRIDSQYFAPYQVFTYMFAHADLMHILFNMLGLAFLGPSLEMVWGRKKVLDLLFGDRELGQVFSMVQLGTLIQKA